jgi:hypothetical protein
MEHIPIEIYVNYIFKYLRKADIISCAIACKYIRPQLIDYVSRYGVTHKDDSSRVKHVRDYNDVLIEIYIFASTYEKLRDVTYAPLFGFNIYDCGIHQDRYYKPIVLDKIIYTVTFTINIGGIYEKKFANQYRDVIRIDYSSMCMYEVISPCANQVLGQYPYLYDRLSRIPGDEKTYKYFHRDDFTPIMYYKENNHIDRKLKNNYTGILTDYIRDKGMLNPYVYDRALFHFIVESRIRIFSTF